MHTHARARTPFVTGHKKIHPFTSFFSTAVAAVA